MHSHTPKQPIPPPSRERPLQKSMFLPEHYPPTPPIHSQQSNDHPSYTQLKRSLIQNTGPSNSNQYQFRTGVNNNLSFNSYQLPSATHAPFAHLDARSGSHHQLLQHSSSASNMKHSTSFQRNDTPVEYEFKNNFTKPDKMRQSFEGVDNKNIVNDVITQIKDKHLPSLFSGFKLQFKQELNQLKHELIALKEDMKNHKMKQQQINNELRNQGSSKLTDSHSTRRSSVSEKDQDLSELQKDFFLLEGKIKQIESKINEGFSLLGQSIDTINLRFDQELKSDDKFSVSAIKSNLPAIMLEYKEMFWAKSGEPNRKIGHQEQITISTCKYFIDKNGFLLDHESRYLVDWKGSQVRLEEKHLKLLQKHKILHR